jgi:hypothetical protein
MEYKLHRVAPNSEGWVRPSPRRLDAAGVGGYVMEHGFAHEDWNFNFGFASNGRMLGYTVARPSKKLAAEEFGVVLATYDPLGWKAVGYYNAARFIGQTSSPPDTALQQMAADVFELAEKNQIAPRYRKKTLSQIELVMKTEFIHHCWVIPADMVFVWGLSDKNTKNYFQSRYSEDDRLIRHF